MTLYLPSFTELTLAQQYLMRGWTASTGCNKPSYPYYPPPGWSCDSSYPEFHGSNGSHGGCYNCAMTNVQILANYQTEVTFITNPIGAQVFIDGIEWWPGALTAADGATFRGISPVSHTYELRKSGDLEHTIATGSFTSIVGTSITITKNLFPLGIKVTNIVQDVTNCAAPCNVNIEVTWTNDAITDMEFTPSLMIDSIPISPAPYPPEILLTGTSVTHAFLISGLTAAYYQICATPDIVTLSLTDKTNI